MTKNGNNYINGQFKTGPRDLASFNPCTEEVIGYYPQSTKSVVDAAVSAARNAFHEWRLTSRVYRAECLAKLARAFQAGTEQLTNVIALETGKSLNESRAEVVEALHMIEYAVGKGREATGEMFASEIADRDAYVIRKPKGVVGIISPWNFPCAIMGAWCAAPALLEGNTVVCKPSELTPAVADVIAQLYYSVGFPPGVFNVVYGNGTTGAHLVVADVDHIAFTGSPEAGQHIRQVCANSWHKTCNCEMGSKSAVIVFDDADMDLAVSASVNSALKLSGQRCVSAGRILVQRSVFSRFVDQFVADIDKAEMVDPFKCTTHGLSYGPLISLTQRNRVVRFNEMVAQDPDVKVYRLGRPEKGTKGYWLKPTVYSCEWADKPFLKQEVFGPHVALVPFDSVEDAIRIYNDTPYGLSVGVITNNFRTARRMRMECDFGMGYWNGGSIAAESHLPFGGIKKSGMGGASAAGMFDTVVHKVAWSVSHGSLSFPQGLK